MFLPCLNKVYVCMYVCMFWDSYNSAIHFNEAISDIDKFNYLKSLVEGMRNKFKGLCASEIEKKLATGCQTKKDIDIGIPLIREKATRWLLDFFAHKNNNQSIAQEQVTKLW